jgi:hypothetical protein
MTAQDVTEHGPFVLWTVYDRPADFPGLYVARKFTLNGPTSDVMAYPSLEPLREVLRHKGLCPIPRSPDDDPVIIESWI